MYTLYYAPGTASLVVHWLLIEIGARHELRKLDLAAREHKRPEYLAINPAGRVPTLLIHGEPMTEAAAMVMHLADAHPNFGLAPTPGTVERARYYQWIVFLANTLQPAFRDWYYPEEAARDPEPIAATLTSISQLLYGQSAGAGVNVTQHLLKCNDYVNCDAVTLNTTYTHTPFTAKVETLMRSIAEKIATRTAIPNNSAEVGFVNQTTEPVYKMLSVGATIPGSGLADSLSAQYRDVIAADYAYVFLERNLRLGMAALEKDHLLQHKNFLGFPL